jgi:hypothetical protein
VRYTLTGAEGVFSLPAGERAFALLDSLEAAKEATGGAGAGLTAEGLRRMDQGWTAVKNTKAGKEAGPAPKFVTESAEPLGVATEFDAVSGGVQQGHRSVSLHAGGWLRHV